MARLVGIDVGSTTIKVVELDNSGTTHKLIARGVSATPPRGLLSDASFDQLALSHAIKKTYTDAKCTTKSVNIALPEHLVFTRIVEMPMLSDKELASAIRWEAEQYIPLPLQEVVLDYQVIQKGVGTKASPRMAVFLVAAPKALVNKYQKIVDMAELELVSIETEVVALNRSLVDGNPDSPVTLLVSIGADSTGLSISKGASIILTYVIPSGGKALTRALVTDLGLDQTAAEEYKKTYGLKKEVLSGKISTTFKPVIENIVAELKRTISFYQSKNPEIEPIRRVVLTGGSAKLPGLVVYLAEELSIETQIGDPWQKIVDTQKVASSSFDPILFSESVGLALKPLS